MTIQDALLELEKYAEDFASIGDGKTYWNTNKDDFMHKWIKVYQYFNYVVQNVKPKGDEYYDALAYVYGISEENPSLSRCIEDMVNTVTKKVLYKINIKVVVEQVQELIEQLQNMNLWDTDKVTNIQYELEEYQKLINNYKQSIETDVYQELMNKINSALNSIENVNSKLNDVDEIVKGM